MTPNYFRFIKRASSGGDSGLASVMPSDDLALLLDPSLQVYTDAGSTAATDGDEVYQWTDQVNSLNATQSLAGANTTYKPTWHESDSDWNNKPYLQFTDGHTSPSARRNRFLVLPDHASHRSTTMTIYFIREQEGDWSASGRSLFHKTTNSFYDSDGMGLYTTNGNQNTGFWVNSKTHGTRNTLNTSTSQQPIVTCVRYYSDDGANKPTVTHDGYYEDTPTAYNTVHICQTNDGTKDDWQSKYHYHRNNTNISDPGSTTQGEMWIGAAPYRQGGWGGIHYHHPMNGAEFKLFGFIIYNAFHTDSEVATNQEALNTYFGGSLW